MVMKLTVETVLEFWFIAFGFAALGFIVWMML